MSPDPRLGPVPYFLSYHASAPSSQCSGAVIHTHYPAALGSPLFLNVPSFAFPISVFVIVSFSLLLRKSIAFLYLRIEGLIMN